MANEKRLIDANAAIDYCHKRWGIDSATAQFLREQPTVDAVEVVRCKDCCMISEPIEEDEGKMYCSIMCEYVKDDGFCSYGERKDNDSNNL